MPNPTPPPPPPPPPHHHNRTPNKTLTNPSKPQLRSLAATLPPQDESETHSHYTKYLHAACTHTTGTTPRPPRLDIVPSPDLHVTYTTSRICDCHRQMLVERPSSQGARNYMGYSEALKCYAFKGQRRLVPNFLDLTAEVLPQGHIKVAIFQPRLCWIPDEGLGPGLEYGEFVDLVSIWDVILLLAPTTVTDPLNMDAMATLELVPPKQLSGPELVRVYDADTGQAPETTSGEAATGTDPAAIEQQVSSRYRLRTRSKVNYN